MKAAASRMRERFALWTAGAVALFALVVGIVSSAQSTSGTMQTTNQRTMSTGMQDVYDPSMPAGNDPLFVERRLRRLNAAQHDSMVVDTHKLVVLVAELNSEISSQNSPKLTTQQMRMAAEIEKLARNVRDKMRMSVRPMPDGLGNTYVPTFGQHN
jgi:hypothetical protein